MGGAAVVVLAAGSGSRVGGPVNKVLLPVDGRPIVAWSVADALATPGVDRVLVVVRAGEQDAVATALGELGSQVEYIEGGASRHQSEWRALTGLAARIDSGAVEVVALHDAARPRAGVALFTAILEAARTSGGAVPVVDLPCVVTRDGRHLADRLVAVQTPQAFRAGPLLSAYRAADGAGFEGTDTAACVERFAPQLRIVAVPGADRNAKITFAPDLDR